MVALIDRVDNATIAEWRERLDAILPTHIDGTTPEGCEVMRSFQYLPDSVRFIEAVQHPELELLLVTISYRAKITELTSTERFRTTELEKFLELRARPDFTFDLSDVDFLAELLS